MPSFLLALYAAGLPHKTSPDVEPLADQQGIHNLFRLGTNLYSGSAPEGDAGFAALEKLGVKTIITVDGTKPDLTSAQKHGMRYVHLPHGYDGISTNVQLQLIKAAETLPGPIFVHCHHGKHRGPTAVAVICMSELGWNSEQATKWLIEAGTATNYAGLYDVVKKFQKPSAEQLSKISTQFPETAEVSGLTDTMVDVDARWDHLKSVRAAGYKTPKASPDIVAANEAVILWEHYREAQRLPASIQHGKKFLEKLATAEAEAKEAERLLREFATGPNPAKQSQLDKAFDAMGKSCAACHKEYRDPAGTKSLVQ